MSKLFFHVSVSLDGYLVPPGMDLEHAGDSNYQDWGAQWGKLHSWIFPTAFFREAAKLGEGGETGIDNQIAEGTFQRTGVSIMGKRARRRASATSASPAAPSPSSSTCAPGSSTSSRSRSRR